MRNHFPLFIASAVLSLSPERTTATVRFDLDSKMSFHSLPHELEMEAYLGELLEMLGLPHNIPVLVDPAGEGLLRVRRALHGLSLYRRGIRPA